MALDFIFGPRTRLAEDRRPEAGVWTRSVKVDLDSLRDVIELAREWVGEQDPILMVNASGANGRDRTVTIDDLPIMTEKEQRRLTIRARSQPDFVGEPRTATITFDGPFVMVEPDGAHVRDAIVGRLLDEKHPLIDWVRLKTLGPVAFTVLLAMLWLVVELTAWMPVAAHFLGWAIALVVIRFGLKDTRRRSSALLGTAGHRIALETRLDIIKRRNGHKRDVQVAALAVLGTIVAGVVVAAIAYVAGWSPA